MPYFSIIIPVYNVKQYLEKCLESVLGQSFMDFECILVDDGSQDGSSQICDDLASSDGRIRVVHKDNEGVAIARNTGIRMATGEFLMFLDSDDTLSAGLLENCVQKLNQTGSDILVFGYQRVTTDDISILQSIPVTDCTRDVMLEKNYDLSLLLWNKIYARKLFDRIDLERLRGITFSEDSILAVDMMEYYASFSYVHKTLSEIYYYSKHGENVLSIFLMKILVFLLWINPVLVKKNRNYLIKLLLA